MKKNEKRMILILVAITLVVTIIFIATRNKPTEEGKGKTPQVNTQGEEFVNVQEDGTRVNTSSKLAETKKIDGLEISNITLTEKDNETYLRADVKNTSSSKQGDELINLIILDKAGNEITTIYGYLDTLEPGATAKLRIKASADFANAYDFRVSK